MLVIKLPGACLLKTGAFNVLFQVHRHMISSLMVFCITSLSYNAYLNDAYIPLFQYI